jgi:gas vesicle protein
VLNRQRLRTFVLGGAVGALVGILLAPRSGKELRGSLANRAGEARERGRETYFDAQEQMRERLAEAREGSRGRSEGADLGGSSLSSAETGTYPATSGPSPWKRPPVPKPRGRMSCAGR